VGSDGVSRRGFLIGGLAVAGTVTGGVVGAGSAWAATPEIIDCTGWGARANSDIVQIWNQRPVKILVHHTATPNVTDLSRGAADRLARGIQNFHMDHRGWLDTGQHFTISRGGYVLEGRHRSLEVLRIGKRQVEGAHCTGQNVVAVGIENEGTYTAAQPPGQLWNRLRDLCAYICQQYGITPTEIFGHRDFKDTACPGDVLYGMLPQLRTEVAGVLGQRLSGRVAVKESWPLLRVADRGPAVLAAQHLLRAVGMTEVATDGNFDRPTADAVRRFQAAHGTEEVNGMIGGESWPLLVRAVRPGEDGEAARAARALVRADTARTESLLGAEDWQRLLSATTLSR
jgi:hypothetical protein